MPSGYGNRWLMTFVLFSVSGFGLLSGTPARAQAESSTQIVRTSFNETVFVSCANNGEGEFLQYSGTFQNITHLTVDATGGFHVKVVNSSQGISAVGLTTGNTYHAIEVAQRQFTFYPEGLPAHETTVTNFLLIGEGTESDFLAHEEFHLTINAQGELTVNHGNVRFECR